MFQDGLVSVVVSCRLVTLACRVGAVACARRRRVGPLLPLLVAVFVFPGTQNFKGKGKEAIWKGGELLI